MNQNLPFVEGMTYYRNTWVNSKSGKIRTNLYTTEERAIISARNAGHQLQEVATPVRAEYCLINPRHFHHG